MFMFVRRSPSLASLSMRRAARRPAAVTPQLPVAEVVDEDEQDVRLRDPAARACGMSVSHARKVPAAIGAAKARKKAGLMTSFPLTAHLNSNVTFPMSPVN